MKKTNPVVIFLIFVIVALAVRLVAPVILAIAYYGPLIFLAVLVGLVLLLPHVRNK